MATAVAGWLLRKSGLFQDGWTYPSLDQLDHVGAFLSGVFTPLALAWAARSFLLQRQQMSESFQAMQEQIETQRKANDLTSAAMEEQLRLQRQANEHTQQQIDDDRVHRREERERTGPDFTLAPGLQIASSGTLTQKLVLQNIGLVARRTRISWIVTDRSDSRRVFCNLMTDLPHPLQPNEKREIDIILRNRFPPENELHTVVRVQTERADGEYGLWVFSFDGYSRPTLSEKHPIYPDARF
ncbi:hypothetical protein [Rhodanobacter sp. C03]|uniref:hypothetical protein n=1 Tax=Rhodanobacter sp. C03 TaxID=1945858 RepID=UPI00143AD735|nr:hypothetical protein [Rhodanobacter sp. C03]